MAGAKYPRKREDGSPRLTQISTPINPEHYDKLLKLAELQSNRFGVELTRSAMLDVLINKYLVDGQRVEEAVKQRLAERSSVADK